MFIQAIILGLIIDLLIYISFAQDFLKYIPLIPLFVLGSLFFFRNSQKIIKHYREPDPEINFSLWEAIKSHLFNPNPYLFWLFIGRAYLQNDDHGKFFIFFILSMLVFKIIHISLLILFEKKYSFTFFKVRNFLISSIYSFYGLQMLFKAYNHL